MIKEDIKLIAEVVQNHELNPIKHYLKHSLTDLRYALQRVFHDDQVIEFKNTELYSQQSVYEAIKQTTLTHQPQMLRIGSPIPNLDKIKLKHLVKSYLADEAPKSIFGGWVHYNIVDNAIGSNMDIVYDCRIVDKRLNASNLFLFNQNTAISAGHIDAECGYLFLKTGLKIWITVPFDNEKFDEEQWNLTDLLAENNRRWFYQLPGDIVIVSGSIKHMVITLKPSVAVGGYFNNSLGTLDSIALYTKIRALDSRLALNNTLEQFGINSISINYLLSNFIQTFPLFPIEKQENLKTLFNARKNDFDIHIKIVTIIN